MKKKKISRKKTFDLYTIKGKTKLRKRKNKKSRKPKRSYYSKPIRGIGPIDWKIKEDGRVTDIFLGDNPSERLTNSGIVNIYIEERDKVTFQRDQISTTIQYDSPEELDILYWNFIKSYTRYGQKGIMFDAILLEQYGTFEKKPIQRDRKMKYTKTPQGFIKQAFKKSDIKKSYIRKVKITDYRGIQQRRKVRIYVLG